MFLVSPCCVHRDRRPDQTVSVVPSPRFVLFVFSSVFFVPVFCPSRQASPHTASPHARRSREFTPPFAALPSRRSREFSPPFAAQPSRRSREFTPPFADQPAHSSQEMTPPSTANPSLPARRWLNARRPASDSMPAGLPLTQCPPACLWLNARRPASDSMPAGLLLTQARRIAADSSSPDCRWLMPAGRRWQGKPTHFISSRRRLRLTDPAVRGRSRRRPWGKPTHRQRLPLVSRGKPTRRPRFTRPAAGWGSLQPAGPCRCVVKPAGCCRYLSSQPVMVSPAGRYRIDKPAGRGRIWPDCDQGLFNCLCVFTCAPWPPELPAPPWPPELPAPPWPPELPAPPGPRSVCSTLEAPSCVCICVGPVGSPECPPPLPGSTVTARDVPSGRGELC